MLALAPVAFAYQGEILFAYGQALKLECGTLEEKPGPGQTGLAVTQLAEKHSAHGKQSEISGP